MSLTISRERIFLYALLTALTAFSIDALLPALREIGAELAATRLLSAQHIVSLFILGMSIGELFAGPISDAIGRKRVITLGLSVYTIGTLVALSVPSLEGVIVGRILQGVGVAGPKIATRAMIRDQFEGDTMARVMSYMFSLFIIVPMVAPALGQGILVSAGWRAIFMLYLVLALFLGAWLAIRHPETLQRENCIPLRPRVLLSNGAGILSNQSVTLLIAATGLVFGVQLLYLSIAADLFSEIYGVRSSFPFYFALLAGGIGLGSYLNGRIVGHFGMNAMVRGGFIGMTVAGIALLAISILFEGHPPFAAFMALGFAIFFSIGILFGNLNAMAMRSLVDVAGLGASLIASGSSLVATLFALSFGAICDGSVTTLSMGISMAGAVALILSELSNRASGATVEVIR